MISIKKLCQVIENYDDNDEININKLHVLLQNNNSPKIINKKK